MSIRNVTRRIVKSFGLAAVLVASMLAGFAGTATAAPAQQGGTANVMISMPASVGQFDQSPSQSWVSLFRLADHKAYTGTVQTATAATRIGDPGNHTANYRGNREFVANGVEPGDYLVVAHLGPNTLVMNTVRSIADGNQYPNQTDTFIWMGSGTSAAKAKTGTTAAKPAVPLGTPLCVLTATKPITTAGKAFIAVGGPFVGTLVFVPGGKLMTIESAVKLAKDPTKVQERSLVGIPAGTKVEIGSGDWHVFRRNSGGMAYLGYLAAVPSTTALTDLTSLDGVCKVYDLKLMGAKAATTGSGLNLLAMLALAACVVGLVINNRRRFFPGTVSAS